MKMFVGRKLKYVHFRSVLWWRAILERKRAIFVRRERRRNRILERISKDKSFDFNEWEQFHFSLTEEQLNTAIFVIPFAVFIVVLMVRGELFPLCRWIFS